VTTSVAVLAAGRGVRFGGDRPKQLLELGGRPLAAYAFDAALASGLAPQVCVASHPDVAALAKLCGLAVENNPNPEAGIASSMQVVLRALADTDVDAVVIGLADQPLVGAEAYRRLGATDVPLAVATYDGVNGNPVRIARSLWAEALELGGDEGVRVLVRRHGATLVPCDDTGEPTDIDTPADFAALERRWRSQTASE
jgi:molybdenum cofactor cytidylyltransferase